MSRLPSHPHRFSEANLLISQMTFPALKIFECEQLHAEILQLLSTAISRLTFQLQLHISSKNGEEDQILELHGRRSTLGRADGVNWSVADSQAIIRLLAWTVLILVANQFLLCLNISGLV